MAGAYRIENRRGASGLTQEIDCALNFRGPSSGWASRR